MVKVSKVEKSKLLSLTTKDFIKSLVMAGFVSFFSALTEVASSDFTFDKTTLMFLLSGFVSGMLGYLTRNYTRNSDGKQFTKEATKELKKIQKTLKKK